MASMDWSTQSGDAPSGYEEFLVPAMFAPFAERLVDQAGVHAGSRVLDVACGTGAVSRAAARRAGPSGSVTGVDMGDPTLEIARSRPAREGAAPVAYVQSDAAMLPFAAHAFDVVLCQQGLQFFPDREKALAEMHRVLDPGGVIGVSVWTDLEHSPFMAVADALTRHVSVEAGEMMRSPFGLADLDDLTSIISSAGFRDLTSGAETIECTWASHSDFAHRLIAAGPVAQLFIAAPEQARAAVAAEVETRLQTNATPDGRLQMPMTTNVTLART